jgi:hypothetical protein
MSARRDTSPEAADLYARLLAQRSREERFLMGCEMFDTSRALVQAGLAAQGAWKDEGELRVRLFLRFYGQDFHAEERDRVVEALRQWGRAKPPTTRGE